MYNIIRIFYGMTRTYLFISTEISNFLGGAYFRPLLSRESSLFDNSTLLRLKIPVFSNASSFLPWVLLPALYPLFFLLSLLALGPLLKKIGVVVEEGVGRDVGDSMSVYTVSFFLLSCIEPTFIIPDQAIREHSPNWVPLISCCCESSEFILSLQAVC